MLIEDSIHIWREADGSYHFDWKTSHPDTDVVVEPITDSGSVQVHYEESGESRARLQGLPGANRHFFRLRDQHGNESMVTERRLGMHGSPNFRDFGGYRTSDGSQVKWGYLFRSGQLSQLSEQDIALMASLGLDLICDFRRLEEQENDPSRLPAERKPEIASLPITPGSNANFFEQGDIDLGSREAMFEFMVDINRDLAEAQIDTYARMFREILSREETRFLVHCAAGKDRTGFAAAIILLALGVPRDVVMRDYLLSAKFFNPMTEIDRLRSKYQMEMLETDSILPMLEVHEDYLAKALDTIVGLYGSVETYLEEALGVGPAELRELRRRYLA